MNVRRRNICPFCQLDREIPSSQCMKVTQKDRLNSGNDATPTRRNEAKIIKKDGQGRDLKCHVSMSLPGSPRTETLGCEDKGTQVRFRKEKRRLEYSTESLPVSPRREKLCVTPTIQSISPDLLSDPTSASSPSSSEILSLRANLLHSLAYQNNLHLEMQRLTSFLDSEKRRWMEQFKRLKDEHLEEIEMMKKGFDEKLKLAIASFSSELVKNCEREKAELRISLEFQYKTNLNLIKEELKRQFEIDLQTRVHELKFTHEELAQRLSRQEKRVKEETRLEMEEERCMERRRYEELLKERMNSVKGECERKVKEMQDQNGKMRKEIEGMRGEREGLERVGRSQSTVMCCRCKALVDVSAQLDGKLAQYRTLLRY